MPQDWSPLDQYLIAYRGRAVAAGDGSRLELRAALELVREGQLEVHQQRPFAPLYLRKRPADTASLASNVAVEMAAEPENG